jgi:hypothetical protein
VIAAREDVDAVAEQFLGQLRRDPEPSGGIFAVGDSEVDIFRRDNTAKMLRHQLAAGRAKNVADEEKIGQEECFLEARQDGARP